VTVAHMGRARDGRTHAVARMATKAPNATESLVYVLQVIFKCL